MGSILVLALATWLFLLVLAVAILRMAARADRDAEERRRSQSRPQPGAASRRGRAARVASVAAALPLASATFTAPDAEAQSCKIAPISASSATLCLINLQRQSRGLATLDGNARLGRAANRHADDMVRRGYFAHASPEGRSFTDRLRGAGYFGGCSWWAGEALAWGSGTQSSATSRVSAWMHSPPHRAILLGAVYREAGIAVVQGTPGFGPSGLTYVAEFGRRRC